MKCQATDWNTHSLLCHDYSIVLRPHDPTGTKRFYRAINFEQEEMWPKIVWREVPGPDSLRELLRIGSAEGRPLPGQCERKPTETLSLMYMHTSYSIQSNSGLLMRVSPTTSQWKSVASR